MVAAGQRRRVVVAAGGDKSGGGGGGGLGDELLDFLYAGKKLRKWYGQEGQVLPRDGGRLPDPEEQQRPEDEEEMAEREYVAVLDADGSPMAEQVVLQLILNRTKIRALVKDTAAAKDGFGPYIEIVQGDSSDAAAVKKLLRGAKAAVCCSRLGALLPAAAATRLPHVVLLTSAAQKSGGLAGLFGGAEQATLSDAAREQQLRASGLPHTIVQVPSLKGVPGGTSSLALTANGKQPQGQVSREDAAKALAEAAERDVEAGSLVLQISSAGAGAPPDDWQAAFADLLGVSA